MKHQLVSSECKVRTLAIYMARPQRKNWGNVEYCHSHATWVKTCHVCGEKFHVNNRHSKTCSDKCRKILSRTKV